MNFIKLSNVLLLSKAEFFLLIKKNKGIVLLLSLVICLAVLLQAGVTSIVRTYAKRADRQSALSLIEINSFSTHSAKEISDRTLSGIHKINHVESVTPWFQHDLDIADSTKWPDPSSNPDAIWATPYIESRMPRVLKGSIPAGGLKNGQIVLPHTVKGGTLDSLVGEKIEFGYTVVQGKGQGTYARINLAVIATYDNSISDKDGEQPSYMNLEQLKQLFGRHQPQQYTAAYVKVDSAQNVQKVQKNLSELGFSVTGAANNLSDAVGIVGTLNKADKYSLLALAILSAIFGYFAGSIWFRQRRRDTGLLRAIGWTARMVFALSVCELALLGLVSVFTGVFSGTVFIQLYTLISSYYENSDSMGLFSLLSWKLIAQLFLLVPAIVITAGMIQCIKIARTAPDELLRD